MSLLPIPSDKAAWHALRAKHIGASEVAALFNMQAAFQPGIYALWMDRAGRVPLPPVEIERAQWGLRLEDAIAAGAARLNKVPVAARPSKFFASWRRCKLASDICICNPVVEFSPQLYRVGDAAARGC